MASIMNESKKKASVMNMATMAIYQIVSIVAGFLIPKLFLETYGAELHGYTSTVNEIMSYIALFNAGLGTAAIQALYAPLAAKDNKSLSSIVRAIDKFYIKTGVLYTVSVLGCAVVLPFIINSDIPSWEIAALMIVMGSTSTLECFIYSKHRVLLQSSQRLFVVNISDCIAIIIRSILQIVLIKFKFNIVIVQAVPVAMVLLRMFILSVYVKRSYPMLDRKAKPFYGALSKRWSAFMHQIAGLVVFNTDVVILTFFTNLIYVSIYSVYNLVFSHLYRLMTNVFSMGTVASFGLLISEQRNDTLQKSYSLYEFVYYFAITLVYSVTACMILPFVSVYTKNMENIPYVDIKLAVLFVIIGIINNLRVPGNTMINAAGHFKETQWRAILEAVINLTVSLILVKPLGIYGVLVGTVCSFAYRVSDIIYYSSKYILKRSLLIPLFRVLRVAIIIILNVIIYNFVLDWKNVHNFYTWFIHVIVSGVISLFVCVLFSFVFERNELKAAIEMFGKRIATKK